MQSRCTRRTRIGGDSSPTCTTCQLSITTCRTQYGLSVFLFHSGWWDLLGYATFSSLMAVSYLKIIAVTRSCTVVSLRTASLLTGQYSCIHQLLIAICCLTTVLDITTIVLSATRYKLTPSTFLILQYIKGTVSFAFLSWRLVTIRRLYLGPLGIILGVPFPLCLRFSDNAHPTYWQAPQRGRYTGDEGDPTMAKYEYPPPGSYAGCNPRNVTPLQPLRP